MRAAGVRYPGADLARNARDVDDFIRMYDGAGNPVGVGMTDSKWRTALGRSGFGVDSCEAHYFPKRFVPFHDIIPGAIHYLGAHVPLGDVSHGRAVRHRHAVPGVRDEPPQPQRLPWKAPIRLSRISFHGSARVNNPHGFRIYKVSS